MKEDRRSLKKVEGEGVIEVKQRQEGETVQKKAKGGDIRKYIQEELLALLPRYRNGGGETIVYTIKGSYADPRGVPWLVERLVSYYSLNLPELRRRCGRLLNLRHHISLPLSGGLVLLPVKMRQSVELGETTTGFINLQQVQKILPPPAQHPSPPEKESPAWLSRVQFKCGLQLKTLNTPETHRDRLRQGEIVLQDFLKRRSQGAPFAGLSRQALLEQLPDCDCVLKDIFIELFGLNNVDK